MAEKLTAMVVFLFAVTIALEAQEIKRITFSRAIIAQKKEPKRIFIDVYTSWCDPCKMLSNNTFASKDSAKYVNGSYYAVKFNGEGDEVINYKGQRFENRSYDPALADRRNSIHPFTNYLQVQAHPIVLSLDENADLTTSMASYMVPSQLEVYLKLSTVNDYKKITTQQEFQNCQNNSKSTFKAN